MQQTQIPDFLKKLGILLLELKLKKFLTWHNSKGTPIKKLFNLVIFYYLEVPKRMNEQV